MKRHFSSDTEFERQNRERSAKKFCWSNSPSPAGKILIFAGIFLAQPSAVYSQSQQNPSKPVVNSTMGALPSASPLSKFEARRIRHRCRDLVPEAAANKDFRHCFEMHIAARRLWGECKRKVEVANLSRSDKNDAIKQCVMDSLGSNKKASQR
jgi:hypothetical protein